MKTKKKTLKKRWSAKKLIGLCVMMLALCSLFAVGAFADEAMPATANVTPASQMSELIEAIFSSFGIVIESLASGLKNAFSELVYVDPAAATPIFSPLIIFIFVTAGLGLAAGILFKIFALIKNKSHG